ncbi:MAG: sigma-E factor negative regulatory protein [Gallionellaceae bacterium]|nr:sigma-E factor negative regulatory protein [Gallionellaceae bacterium]
MDKLNAQRLPDTDAEEWLSALFDGELDPDESKRGIVRAGKEADAARLWAEYSLIGDVMRGCRVERPGLNARILAALAEEPTVLAPMPAEPVHHRPYYLMAAAAAVAAIAWTVIYVSPQGGGEPAVTVAANDVPATVALASNNDAQPYLAAHQDYAYAVAGEPEMRFTQVSLAGGGQ